jgi:hypothetical protein
VALFGRLVGHFHRGLERHDLGSVFSRRGRGGDPLLAFDDVSIERFARVMLYFLATKSAVWFIVHHTDGIRFSSGS